MIWEIIAVSVQKINKGIDASMHNLEQNSPTATRNNTIIKLIHRKHDANVVDKKKRCIFRELFLVFDYKIELSMIIVFFSR